MFTNNGPPGIMFSVVPIFFFVIFFLVFGIVIVGIVKSIGQWKHNNSQPVLNVAAKVISKRTYSTSSIHNDVGENGIQHVESSTSYHLSLYYRKSFAGETFLVKPKYLVP